jgi:anti-sigma B factor antagonist
MEEFVCRTERVGSWVVVHLFGDADLAAVSPMRVTGGQVFGEDGVRAIDVDCSGVTFLDCSGLGVFIEWNNMAKATGTLLCFRRVPQCVLRILALTDLDRALTITDTCAAMS